ncbi:hypothetical protein LEP1GSC051_0451 [Leptospira sp. P2653]|uniref:Uncharacterized protein n=1 Tax=Leptospira weilii str. UI 13098 TaxID=1088542 RepID=M6Q4B6_9LEPT|nr:hypothetical protein LEP1GSC051_0451 [Leptospira sp. P2653]EMN88000.1 hypothetical protein LEP1GSC108_0917 [Leptospira weilii str. UI 13098]
MLRVHASYILLRFGSSSEFLRNHILKRNAFGFKTVRVHVGDVVSNDIHSDLMVLKSGYTGIE